MPVTRRRFVQAMTGAALAGGRAAMAQDRRPNVLFILTDDQRWDTVSALGNPHIRTPNLDRLVRDGTIFRNAYCMGGFSGAVCLPSRMMALRGRAWFSVRDLPEGFPNLPRSMGEAGYETCFFGKRGNSDHESQACFGHTHYLQPGDIEAVVAAYPDDEELIRRSPDHAVTREGKPGRNLCDHALQWLARWGERRADGAAPFFMYLAGPAPHDPRIAPQEYLDMYPLDEMLLPDNYLPHHPFDNGDLFVRDERLAPWPRTEDEIRRHLRDYYAVITHLDEQLGRLLDWLRETGEYDNTHIIFSADQGIAIGSHGLMGKQNVYEHTLRVPLVLSGPGIPRGEERDAFAYLFDVYPTICDLVGAPVPESLEGHSLAPVIAGERDGIRDTIFLAYKGIQRAVRRGEWKLIRYPEIDRTQLFSLADDPHEMSDLAADPAQADRVADLMSLMTEQQRLFGDDQPLHLADSRPGDIDIGFSNEQGEGR